MSDLTCSVDECSKPPRSPRSELCKMHYHRWYRHGSVDKVVTGSSVTASHGRKYRALYRPGHPLAARDGRIYEHRMVLFEKIGPGEHPCHWCRSAIVWVVGKAPRMLTVDHLDGHGDNNDPDNLVPSCGRCNSARARAAKAVALKENGWWSNNDTRRPRRPRNRAA